MLYSPIFLFLEAGWTVFIFYVFFSNIAPKRKTCLMYVAATHKIISFYYVPFCIIPKVGETFSNNHYETQNSRTETQPKSLKFQL